MAASACVIQLRVADPKVGTKLLPKDAVCELLDSLEQARVAWRPSQLCQWLLHITITDLIVNEAVKHSDHVPTMYESVVGRLFGARSEYQSHFGECIDLLFS